MKTDPYVSILQDCSLHALLMLVSKALTRAGYGDVELMDRRLPKERSRHCGHELLCHTNLGTTKLTAVVKVVRDQVRVRMLDELCGVVNRRQADLGILATPFPVGSAAERMLSGYHGARLLMLDGPALAGILRSSGIGLRGQGALDIQFFSELEVVSERLLSFLAREER